MQVTRDISYTPHILVRVSHVLLGQCSPKTPVIANRKGFLECNGNYEIVIAIIIIYIALIHKPLISML